MSRGVKDLRDLICVSRLSFRDSDEEIVSDDDHISQDFDQLSLSSSESDSRNGSAKLKMRISPDSGCITNEMSPTESTLGVAMPLPSPPTDQMQSKARRRRKNKKKKLLDTLPTMHEIPKPRALPPVQSKPDSPRPSRTADADLHDADVDYESKPIKNTKSGTPKASSGNFDNLLCYMDATVVSGWLTRANQSLTDLSTYCLTGSNFVQFAHFWLSDFPDIQKQEIFELELEIFLEELGFAFAVGRDQRKVSQRDLTDMISALFREYPAKLLGSKGSFLYLDYLDVLTSERTDQYKSLLSDVKCSTKNRQYAQWILATRSFALVNVWSAVVNFYRNLLGRHSVQVDLQHLKSSHKNVYEERLEQAIRLGYVDVIHYLIISRLVDPRKQDSNNRSLLFSAIMSNQPKVLNYFLNRVKPPLDVNQASDTGNTPLHAAANVGNSKLIECLVKVADVDCTNPQCDNATPLHLTVMHGHTNCVEILLKAGADKLAKMGDLTAVDMAQDFGHEEILALLQSNSTDQIGSNTGDTQTDKDFTS